MHEISLVRNIFNTLDAQYPKEELAAIKSIYLKVGVLSNIQAVLMQNAFEAVTATDAPQYAHAQLRIEVTPIVIHCNNCQTETVIENYKFICHQCQMPSNNIVSGDELLISGVEF
jgi:hydrogenase nickel incorporation protein HypA/HybF